jgi:hypothetical protein
MYKNTNSASRIHALLTNAIGQGDKSLFAVLAAMFEIKGANEADTAMQVLPRLNWFYAELQSLEEQARDSKLSAHLYDHAFARIRMVFSPMQLMAGWHGMRGNLASDVLLALAFLNEMLPSDEIPIPSEELATIATELEQLKLLALNSDLPIALRRFIQHQLELIELAIAQYPVYGAKALREAGHAAIGEIIGTQGTVEAPTENPEALSRLGQLWKRLNTAADVALKAEKVGQLGHRTLEALSNWLQ